jgi:hypothetical protein
MKQIIWLTLRNGRTAHLWEQSFATGWYSTLCERFTGKERSELREPNRDEKECKACQRRAIT